MNITEASTEPISATASRAEPNTGTSQQVSPARLGFTPPTTFVP